MRQVHPDLGVVADRFGRLLAALARLVEFVLVGAPELARGLLGGPLQRALDDLRDSAVNGGLLGGALAAGQFDLGLLQFALVAAHVGLGRAQGAFGRFLLDRQGFLVVGPAAPVDGHRAGAQFGDAIHPLQEFEVVADHDQRAGAPGLHGVVEPAAGEEVEVVGGLVEQKDVGAREEDRGQAQQDGLTTRELAHVAVQFDPVQAERAQGSQGAFLDVPVVTDRLEVMLGGVSGFDGVQGGAFVGDAHRLVDPHTGVQGDVLGQVGQAAADGHRPPGRMQLPGQQPEQGGLASAVGADQTGAAPAQGQGQAFEDDRAVLPLEGQVGAGDGGRGTRGGAGF
ncbi:hypothetical protein GCM10009642_47710 [Nocardiopsis metallicus]